MISSRFRILKSFHEKCVFIGFEIIKNLRGKHEPRVCVFFGAKNVNKKNTLNRRKGMFRLD